MTTENKNPNIYPNQYIPFVKSQNGLPASESSFWINLVGFILAFSFVLYIKSTEMTWSAFYVLGGFIGILIATIGGLTFLCGDRQFFYNRLKIKRKPSIKRCSYKLLALFGIWGMIAFFYWLIPNYRNDMFADYFYGLQSLFWILAGLGVVYFIFMDMVLDQPKDVYWQLGRWLLGRRKDLVKAEAIELIRGWGVKFFYLSLMLPYLLNRLTLFLNTDYSLISDSTDQFVQFYENLSITMDLAFGAVGYLMTLRIFNLQIRSSEPTLLGWLVTLMCYFPFWSNFVGIYLIQYGTGVDWRHLFAERDIFYYGWLTIILSLELGYALSALTIGLRFSNLTYRGLVTNGPYRFTKHPAYVFKNLSWWCISMPFLAWSMDWQLALRGCLFLFACNVIYYLRAKTEENHLSHYPEYVEYALKMNKKSIFAPVAYVLPFLKYKAPK